MIGDVAMSCIECRKKAETFLNAFDSLRAGKTAMTGLPTLDELHSELCGECSLEGILIESINANTSSKCIREV
jgi:hypothetical protein